MTVNATGEPFLVNDFLLGYQGIDASAASVAVSEAAGTLATYDGLGAGRRESISLRQLDQGGASVRVSTTIRGTRAGGVVATGELGNSVVVWQGRGEADKHGIYLQRYQTQVDDSGAGSASVAVGGEQLVNETIGGRQTDPSVAMATDGRFVVTWTGPSSSDALGVYVRRFSATGEPLGGETLVNTTTADRQIESTVAMNGAGDSVVLWSSLHQDGDAWGIFGQRLSAGGTRLGEEFAVNTTTAGSQRGASVAMHADGSFLAVWSHLGPDGEHWDVMSQQFAADGTRVGSERVVHRSTAGQQRNPQVAGAGDRYWVTWQSGVADGSGWQVRAQALDAAGALIGEEIQVNQLPGAGHQQHPAVALSTRGQGAVVWSGLGAPDRQGVYGQAYEVHVTAGNITLDLNGPDSPGADTTTPFAAGLGPVRIVASDLQIAGAQGDSITRATVQLRATPDGDLERLAVDTLETSIEATYNPELRRLFLSGVDTVANYQRVLRTLTYDNTAAEAAGTRVVDIQVDDATQQSNQPAATIELGSANLVGFAQALATSGATFYGAAWGEESTAQKELFEDGGQFLPFVEVTNPDRTPNAVGEAEEIENYPTWVFADGSRLEGVQSLQTLSERTGVAIPVAETPFIAPLSDTTVLVGSPLHVAIDGYDPNGGPLSYAVSTNNSAVSAEIISGAPGSPNRSARVDVAGYGDLVFELFEQRASRPTERFIDLAQSDFYDDIIFHRVINNFVIQGGDPLGTGTGGSTLGDFDDQFHVDLQHNTTGLLSYAKSTDDTNDSQFFITEGSSASLRNLDFNHSIFGMLVEGESNRAAISDTSVVRPGNTVPQGDRRGDRPGVPQVGAETPQEFNIAMEKVEIFQDTENAVLMLRASSVVAGPVEVTVTASDAQGNTFDRVFSVNVANDPINGRPFLDDIAPLSIAANTSAVIQLAATDVEGEPFVFNAIRSGAVAYVFELTEAGELTVTPPTDFVGTLQIEVRVGRTVADVSAFATSTRFDGQLITIEVA
jgi:cyclophilin family peptidyl-prolyl cis-trans isomerase